MTDMTSPEKPPQGAGIFAGKGAMIVALGAAALAGVALARSGAPDEARIRQIAAETLNQAVMQKEQERLARIALFTAAIQLNSGVMSGAPFAAEHALAGSLARGQPAVAADLAILAPIATVGVPGVRALVHAFEQAAADTLVRERTPQDAGWLGQTYGRLTAVTVAILMEARVNPLGSPTAPLIGDMQQALARGDVGAALTVSEKLPAEARPLFAPWAEQAQRRLDALAASKRLVEKAAALAQDK